MKQVPIEPKPTPAMDAERREHSNLAPQGKMDPAMDESTKFTPEGDAEPNEKIPPSATDPA